MSEQQAQKLCTKCKEVKPMEQFSLNNCNKDKKQHRCTACMSAYTKAYRARKVQAMKDRYANY